MYDPRATAAYLRGAADVLEKQAAEFRVEADRIDIPVADIPDSVFALKRKDGRLTDVAAAELKADLLRDDLPVKKLAQKYDMTVVGIKHRKRLLKQGKF